MKKHYILFHAEGYNGEEKSAAIVLRGFSDALDKLKPKSEDTKRLGAYSWLLDRENDVATLAAIVSEAEGAHLKYRVCFLSSDE